MENGTLIPNATGRARPTHSSFRRVSAVLTAVLLTCTPEAPWVSTPVSCLLTDLSAMAGFRPDSFRCFGTVSCAQLRSSGFPFLLRRCLQKHAPATVHRMAYSEIFTAKSTSCGFHGYYTRYIRSLQAIPRLYAGFFPSPHCRNAAAPFFSHFGIPAAITTKTLRAPSEMCAAAADRCTF